MTTKRLSASEVVNLFYDLSLAMDYQNLSENQKLTMTRKVLELKEEFEDYIW